jgi:hypothetical protein
MKKISILLFYILSVLSSMAQTQNNNKSIHFQGIARTAQGLVIADKKINLRLSIIKDSSKEDIIYQEIKSITTNVLGLFFVEIGLLEENKVINSAPFSTIYWSEQPYYLKIEIDLASDLSFIPMGIHKLSSTPYAFYADGVLASHVDGIMNIMQGGTGVNNLKDLKSILLIDKINNTPDSLKPLTRPSLSLIGEKLNKIDTLTLSNRINSKLNKTDTLSLSNRINQKKGIEDLNSEAIINTLGFAPVRSEYGSFYDTSRQTGPINTAIPINWNFILAANNSSITNNTSSLPTRITITHAGIYKLTYNLQFIKADAGNDEISVWVRRNGAAYLYTNNNYPILGGAIKNHISASYYIDLGEKDYVEIFFSIKNLSTGLVYTTSQSSPSRPATPSAMVSIDRVN